MKEQVQRNQRASEVRAALEAIESRSSVISVASPALAKFNIMGQHTPQSAVLSAVIFNALIIIALVPLALRGVYYRP